MTTILLIAACVVGTFGFMAVMKQRIDARFAHMRAGAFAERVGMRVVAGDPAHNLATMPVRPDQRNLGSARGFLRQLKATQLGGALGTFELRLEGKPYGLDTELVLTLDQTFEPGVTTSTTTTRYDLHLAVRPRRPVVPFDLRKRVETMHLETRRDDAEARMPGQRFGDAALDDRFVIETPDPTLARAIAPALAPLGELPYVHVVGGGAQIAFVMTPAAVMAAAASFEVVLHVLASVAALLEGQPVPRAPGGDAVRRVGAELR